MTKSIAILSQGEINIFHELKKYFINNDVDVFLTNSPLEAINSDLCIVDNYDGFINNNILEEAIFINLHPSLLPAFDCYNPVEQAFKKGVKVSGVTICYLNNDGTNGKIIAQYPIFIDSTMTMDDFSQEVFKVKEKLVPFVAESILDDKIFDFSELLKNQNCNCSCVSEKNSL